MKNNQEIWDGRFLQMASLVATFSKDPSVGVGAVITNSKNQIISQGFNGLPRGAKDDERLHNREWKLKRVLHAEENAVFNANTCLEGCTIYVTHPCCLHCCSVVAQAGISRVVFVEPTADFAKRWNPQETIEYLRELNIEVKGYRRTG